MTLAARILGVSVWGPGLEGWEASRPILAGEAEYVVRSSPPPPPSILAATERRRTSPVVRLALAVAHEAALASGPPPGATRAVFASGNGDGPVVGSILEALADAGDERVVSPTQFHNSVHNAAAGYWSIGTGTRFPATCIGCHDDTWAAGLIAAMAEVAVHDAPVLLCCYDHPLPPPLDAVRPIGAPFAAALVLGPAGAGPGILVALGAGKVERARPEGLLALAWPNPAARALPVLIALARGAPDRHEVPYLDGRIGVEVQP